jgi:hypothetical protein
MVYQSQESNVSRVLSTTSAVSDLELRFARLIAAERGCSYPDGADLDLARVRILEERQSRLKGARRGSVMFTDVGRTPASDSSNGRRTNLGYASTAQDRR